MNSKSQFLAQQELSKWWSSIVTDPRFDRVLLHVSAMAFDSSMTDEQRKGAFLFRRNCKTSPRRSRSRRASLGLSWNMILTSSPKPSKLPSLKQNETNPS